MGKGPWYRIGLSLNNAILLAAIIETIVTCNAASHGLAYSLAEYHYGLHGTAPSNLVEDLNEYPEWALLIAVFIFQMIADAMLWFAVIIKGNKHFALVFVVASFVKTLYVSFIYIMADWDNIYDGLTALQRILSFLWGTILFGFCVVTGIQAYTYLSSDGGRVKIAPIGQGVLEIRDYYKENFNQLAVVLLMSEIITNVHRYFHYPKTSFVQEAAEVLTYKAPEEYGERISIATVLINACGLTLLSFKNAFAHKVWASVYVILTIVHFILLVYVLIDWSPVNIHPQMFNGFVFVSIVHLIYKGSILYSFLKSSAASPSIDTTTTSNNEDN